MTGRGKASAAGLRKQVGELGGVAAQGKRRPCPFIKEKRHVKYYGRYMDDMYLIHADKAYLLYCLAEIKAFCASLKLTVHERKTRIVKLSEGVSFLKGQYVLTGSGRVLCIPGRDSAKRMRRRLKKFKGLVDAGKMDWNGLRCAYRSWRGTFRKRFNAGYCIRRMDALYNGLFFNSREAADGGSNVCIAGKNGAAVHYASLEAMRQMDGIGTPEMDASDAEFEAAGGLVRVIGGEIVLGKTEAEQGAERTERRKDEINAELREIDAQSGRAARAVTLAVSSGKTPAKPDHAGFCEPVCNGVALCVIFFRPVLTAVWKCFDCYVHLPSFAESQCRSPAC
jgi:hypothetical protein